MKTILLNDPWMTEPASYTMEDELPPQVEVVLDDEVLIAVKAAKAFIAAMPLVRRVDVDIDLGTDAVSDVFDYDVCHLSVYAGFEVVYLQHKYDPAAYVEYKTIVE